MTSGTSKKNVMSSKELRDAPEKTGKPENIFVKMTTRIMLQKPSINWRYPIML